MKKVILFFSLILFFAAALVQSQENRGLSFQINPGVNLPMAESKESYTLGGGAEFAGVYSMPFAPWLFAKGLIDYSLAPTLSEDSLSLISFGVGAGVSYSPLPWLDIQGSVSGGYGLGIYAGATGGSPYLEGSGLLSFLLSPTFGIGVGGGYRYYISTPTPFYEAVRINLGTIIKFGAEAAKANIQLPEININPIFPIFYKHYDDNPVGNIIILNSEKGSIMNVKVSFFIDQYMSGPKESITIDEIKKGETAEVNLYALLTDQVLSITEGTKVGANIAVSYEYAGRDLYFETTETVRLHDRNAMTWDDDRKAAAFITAKDPEILKFSKNIAGKVREHQSKAVNLNFRIGMGLFEAMGQYGVNYVIDPQSSYVESSKDSLSLDYLQFPVQTLDYKAGDCDDLSISYSAMLESTGIKTAFITIPGHIYMAFSLGMNPDTAKSLFLNPGDLIYKDNETWLPVEITMVQDGFLKAWQTGAKEWRDNNIDGKAFIYPVHEAWQSYEPVGLTNSGISLEPIDSDIIMSKYGEVVNRFVEREIAEKVNKYKDQLSQGSVPRINNRLGVLYAKYGLMDKAKEQFQQASDKSYVPSMVNMGNILFLEKMFEDALDYYEQVEDEQPNNIKALLGIAKANYELENMGTVKRVFEKIQQKDPDLAERFSYLVSGSDETARASAAMISETVVWDEEE
jgi:tetratricopeptide (TPR) repeat protein